MTKREFLAIIVAVATTITALVSTCNGTGEPEKGMTTEEIIGLLDSSMQNRPGDIQVIRPSGDLSAVLDAVENQGRESKKAQADLLSRILAIQDSMESQGRRLDQVTEFNASTGRTWTTKFSEVDSLSRAKYSIPWQATGVSTFKDRWMDAIIWGVGDSLTAKVTMENVFDVVKYSEGGKEFVRVTNLNPYTYTTGATSFDLGPAAKKDKGKWRLGFTGGAACYSGANGAAPAAFIGITLNR